MKTSDYRCPKCGGVAISGGAAIGRHTWKLKLSCVHPDHLQWIVDVMCPDCGKIPAYSTTTIGKKTVPVLECCDRRQVILEGIFEDTNPFLDERVI